MQIRFFRTLVRVHIKHFIYVLNVTKIIPEYCHVSTPQFSLHTWNFNIISRRKVQGYLSLMLLIVSISFELSSVVGVFTFGQHSWSSDIMLLFTS